MIINVPDYYSNLCAVCKEKFLLFFVSGQAQHEPGAGSAGKDHPAALRQDGGGVAPGPGSGHGQAGSVIDGEAPCSGTWTVMVLPAAETT